MVILDKVNFINQQIPFVSFQISQESMVPKANTPRSAFLESCNNMTENYSDIFSDKLVHLYPSMARSVYNK